MLVNDCMTRDPMVVAPEDSLWRARSTMQHGGIRHLPVVRDGQLAGVITDRDIRDYMPSRCRGVDLHELTEDIERITVDEVMSRLSATIGPEETLAAAASTMLERGVGCLPVVDHGRLIGLITRTDVLRIVASAEARPAVDQHLR